MAPDERGSHTSAAALYRAHNLRVLLLRLHGNCAARSLAHGFDLMAGPKTRLVPDCSSNLAHSPPGGDHRPFPDHGLGQAANYNSCGRRIGLSADLPAGAQRSVAFARWAGKIPARRY